MTRPYVHGAGLPGAGQVLFTEEAKQMGRDMSLTEEAVILRNEGAKVGGVVEEDWQVVETSPFAVENVSTKLPRGEIAEALNEETTHILHFPPDTDVTSDDRVSSAGNTWAVMARIHRTGEPTIMLEARRIS